MQKVFKLANFRTPKKVFVRDAFGVQKVSNLQTFAHQKKVFELAKGCVFHSQTWIDPNLVPTTNLPLKKLSARTSTPLFMNTMFPTASNKTRAS